MGGWSISGITRASTVFPHSGRARRQSLQGQFTQRGEQYSLDLPDYTPGSQTERQPAYGKEYFNTSLFTSNALSARVRRPDGRSMDRAPNFDLALLRNFV
jgi:hypothetical protein